MKDLLIAADVPENCITLEDRSASTYENLRNARGLLLPLGISDILIVTDGYHGPRALMVARALRLYARVATPPKQATNLKVGFRRLRHEAVALPGYALGLIWWLWRDRP